MVGRRCPAAEITGEAKALPTNVSLNKKSKSPSLPKQSGSI
jgi:hypothetical protein